MPMKSRVTNFGGGILAERRGGTRRLHRHDPLGSTIALVNESGVTTDTYRYWPYGEERVVTGTSTNPWRFGGKWGYHSEGANRSYVRACELRRDLGRWMTVDTLWPDESAYGYVAASPVISMDPSGESAVVSECQGQVCRNGRGVPNPNYRPLGDAVQRSCKKISDCLKSPVCRKKWKDCFLEVHPGRPFEKYVRCMERKCNTKGDDFRITCGGWRCSYQREFCGYKEPIGHGCNLHICVREEIVKCSDCVGPALSNYAITLHARCDDFADTVVHELSHCCGTVDEYPGNGISEADWLSKCLWRHT